MAVKCLIPLAGIVAFTSNSSLHYCDHHFFSTFGAPICKVTLLPQGPGFTDTLLFSPHVVPFVRVLIQGETQLPQRPGFTDILPFHLYFCVLCGSCYFAYRTRLHCELHPLSASLRQASTLALMPTPRRVGLARKQARYSTGARRPSGLPT